MHEIRIDRSKPLSAEPHVGHNRYHPRHRAGAGGRRGRRGGHRDPRRGRRPDRAGDHGRGFRRVRGRRRSPADRSGRGQGRGTGRRAGDRVPRHRAAGDRVQRDPARARFPARRHDRTVSRPLDARRRLGDLAADSRRPDPGRALHGDLGRRAVGRKAEGMDRTRATAGRPGRRRRAAAPAGRGSAGRLRASRPAHPATARERRQFRRQAADQGREAGPAGVRPRRVVLDRRRAFRPGRRRGFGDRRGDGGDGGGPLQAVQGARGIAQIHRAGVQPRPLFRRSRNRGAAALSSASWACRSPRTARTTART